MKLILALSLKCKMWLIRGLHSFQGTRPPKAVEGLVGASFCCALDLFCYGAQFVIGANISGALFYCKGSFYFWDPRQHLFRSSPLFIPLTLQSRVHKTLGVSILVLVTLFLSSFFQGHQFDRDTPTSLPVEGL